LVILAHAWVGLVCDSDGQSQPLLQPQHSDVEPIGEIHGDWEPRALTALQLGQHLSACMHEDGYKQVSG
jgi:hypothetical protein